MSRPTAQQVLGHVLLLTGPEEFLNERTVSKARAAVRKTDPEAEISETSADQLTMSTLGELAAPSLFSTVRCVVVRELEDLPEDAAAGVLDYARSPADEVGLILVHSGGQKGKGLLDRLRQLPAVTEVKSATLRPSEYSRFVADEASASGATMSEEAADLLVASVGQDLRSLAAAAGQLASDFPGQALTPSVVRTYFAGRAEVKSFAVADAAIFGRSAVALEELRWALDNGTAPVLVTSAFASGLRGLARYCAAPRGLRDVDLAREVGVPTWKLRTLREQSRGWGSAGLATAITAVARADADVKGAASDPDYALERMVLAVAGAHKR